MSPETRARLLRENAAKFRAQARVDRPQRQSWLDRAASAEARAARILDGSGE